VELIEHNPADHAGPHLTDATISTNGSNLKLFDNGQGVSVKDIKAIVNKGQHLESQNNLNTGNGMFNCTIGTNAIGPTCLIHSVYTNTKFKKQSSQRGFTLLLSRDYIMANAGIVQWVQLMWEISSDETVLLTNEAVFF